MNTAIQTPTRTGAYIDAGAVRTYYEVTGSGEPLLLLHGGLCTAETLDSQTPVLATKYRVYVPERRGHGRTPDVEGPITFDIMAQDTIAFLEALGIPSAHLVGFSDGAMVALRVALQRPELVRKLILVGSPVNEDGTRPEHVTLLESFTRENFPPMFVQLYAAISPDGADHFGVVFDKMMGSQRQGQPEIALDELARVTAPVLVLLGDDDVPTIEHAAAMQRAFACAQLAVVPGTSHALPMEKPELTNRLILDFLADEQVPKLLVVSEMLAQLTR